MAPQKEYNHETESSKVYKSHEDALVSAHLREAEKRRAEPHNLGWASGSDDKVHFIHSKTSKGRLYSELKANNVGNMKVTHQWQDHEGNDIAPPVSKIGTSNGHMID